MDNKDFLENLKKSYQNLSYFTIENNSLILNLDKKYKIPLIYTRLDSINNFIFYLNPKEILQLLYIYELVQKDNLQNNEKEIIKSFMNEYLKLKNTNLNENKFNERLLFCIELLINDCYSLTNNNREGAIYLISLIDEYDKTNNSGKSNDHALVLKKNDNPNFLIENEIDEVKEFEKAGFSTILLITLGIVGTLTYIAFFISTHGI